MTLVALTLLAAAAVTPPADAAPLAPQGAWTLHQFGGRCAISRSYGDGAFALILRQRLDGGRVDVGLVGMNPPQTRDAPVAAHVTTLPGSRQIDGTVEVLARKSGPPIVEIQTPDDPLPDLGAVSALAIGIERKAPIRLAIDQQAAAQAMLRSCHDTLVRSWGIEPAQFEPLTEGKVTGRSSGRTTYPANAVMAHEQGPVSVLIQISPAGRAEQCRVVASSGSVSLDKATCDIAQTKVTFSPARDDAGKPKAMWTILAMNWVLPR